MRGMTSGCVYIKEVIGSFFRHLTTCRKYRGTSFAYPCQACNCVFEDSVRVYKGTTLANTSVGRCTYVGGESIIQNSDIGRFCSIGPEVRIGLGVHPTREVVSCYPGFYSSKAGGPKRYHTDDRVEEFRRIVIGNDVWIGARAMICDGVTVGDGAVIAAGSVVTKSVAPYAIAGGVPAQPIRARATEEQVSILMQVRWWDWPDERIREMAPLMLNLDEFLNCCSRGELR